jgi:putative spermidine/putrescine transport system permease protein
MKDQPLLAWIALGFGLIYFYPAAHRHARVLAAMRRGEYSLDAYRSVLADPQFRATFGYSVVMAMFTIASSACFSWCPPPIGCG